MSLDGAFTALLLLLVSGVSAVIVLPPTNVSVSCQNLRVTASWEYSEQQPKTVFSINVSGSFGRKEFNTTDRQYDLSDFIWQSDDHYMGKYCVTVTAIQGGTRSQPVKSEVFAFNDLKSANKCELDFPPVALIKKDSEAMISFKNPFNFYRELKLAKKKDSAFIHFTVVVPPDDEYDSKCNLDQEDCVFFLKGVEKCVVLKGRLYENPAGGQVKFRENRICMTESTDFHMVTLVILLSVVAVVLVVVMTIICKAKAWTMDLPDLPKFLVLGIRGQGVYSIDSSRVFHEVSCADDSVRTECLSTDEEEEDEQEDEEQEEEEQEEEEQEEEEQEEEEQEEEEQEEDNIPHDRNYDRHHFVQMDMGDGDMVDAYRVK